MVVAALTAATLASSCAYYNTFFFARRYYNQAVRANRQPTKPGSGGGSQSTGISGQTSSLLDKSIEKCAKVITFYPKSKWVDDAIFLMGRCYYLKQDYDKALKKFAELPVYYPKSEFVPKSAFMVGLCAYGKKEYDQSIQALHKALLEHPRAGQSDRASALFTLGEAYWQKKNYAEALVNYKLLTGGKKSEFYFKSLLKAGQCYFELAHYDSARMSFSRVVREDGNDEEVLDALVRTGDSHAAEKNLDSAVRSYQEAMVLAEDFAKVPVVKLKMAGVELAKENYEKAIEIYRAVVTDFPRTPFASEAQFRMGYIYEVYLEDLDKAGQAYDKVKEHMSKSEFAAQAELRGKGLARLRESGKKPGASEEDKKAEPDFLLAELSLFQLGKPDKAIEKYLSVERDFPKSVYAPKSAFAAAYAFLHMKHDTTSAVETGRRVIEKFPNTEYAEAAGEMLKSLNVEMSPELLQKTIPPEPAPADTQKVAARPEIPAQADSLQAAMRGPTRAALPDSAAAPADTLTGGEVPGRAAAPVDTLAAGTAAAGIAAPGVDSLGAAARAPAQDARADSLKTVAPPGTAAPADTFALPEPERPDSLIKHEAERDTSAAK
jgi:TolA-binding protein